MAMHQQFVQHGLRGCDQFAARTVAHAMVNNPFGNETEALSKGQGRFQDLPGEPRVVDCFVETGDLAGSPGSIAFFGELFLRPQQFNGRIFLVGFEQLMNGVLN